MHFIIFTCSLTYSHTWRDGGDHFTHWRTEVVVCSSSIPKTGSSPGMFLQWADCHSTTRWVAADSERLVVAAQQPDIKTGRRHTGSLLSVQWCQCFILVSLPLYSNIIRPNMESDSIFQKIQQQEAVQNSAYAGIWPTEVRYSLSLSTALISTNPTQKYLTRGPIHKKCSENYSWSWSWDRFQQWAYVRFIEDAEYKTPRLSRLFKSHF